MSSKRNVIVRLSYLVVLGLLSPPRAADAQQLPTNAPAALAASTQPAGQQPAIAVDAAEHDFGQVRTGERVEHRFRITNSGSAVLNISNVKTNCGCTVAGEYPRTLAPGASGEIPLALTTTGMNGPFSKIATILSNDPTRPQLTLTLKGEARPLIALQPAGIYFGSIYGEQQRTQTVTITNNGEGPLKLVLDPLASRDGWTFDLAEKEPGKTFELTSTFDPKGLRPGHVRHAAMLLSNVQAQHQIQVQANSLIRDRIEATPSALVIYAPTTQPVAMQAALQVPATLPAQTGRPMAPARAIRVENFGDKPVRVTEVIAGNPALQVSVSEQTVGRGSENGTSLIGEAPGRFGSLFRRAASGWSGGSGMPDFGSRIFMSWHKNAFGENGRALTPAGYW